MDKHREHNIRRLLNNIEQADNCPPQPDRYGNFRQGDNPQYESQSHGYGSGSCRHDNRDDDEWWGRQGSSTSGASATATKSEVVDDWEELEEKEGAGGGSFKQEMSYGREEEEDYERKETKPSTSGEIVFVCASNVCKIKKCLL
jgi:hypothetical protein